MKARLHDWVPRWWRGEAGVVGTLADFALAPAELLFRGIVRARAAGYERGWLRSEQSALPVVSVGNLGVGGAGKTPVAAWIAARLEEWGAKPAIVLRGYGADEILVHRELNPGVPVFAAPRRIDAVREAAAAGHDVVVLDDAFQHRVLRRDLDIVLLSADSWDGRMRLLPRGPWREGMGALRRADLVMVTRKSASPARAAELRAVVRERGGVGKERLIGCLLAAGKVRPLWGGEVADLERVVAGRGVVGVTSLADPRPFHETLRRAGGELEIAAFRDHHEFTREEARQLEERAGGRPLVMTRKEAVKLRGLLSEHANAWMLEQQVEIEVGLKILEGALRRLIGR